jgi:hypothetical protein
MVLFVRILVFRLGDAGGYATAVRALVSQQELRRVDNVVGC